MKSLEPTITLPILNPKINSGASLGYTTIKSLTYVIALGMNQRW